MPNDKEAFEWQVGIWDALADEYQREIDKRFVPVVEGVLKRSGLGDGMCAIDLGSGTGSVSLAAAGVVGPTGRVTAVDVSPGMLATARARVRAASVGSIMFREGRAEAIPVDDATNDAVLASLSMMYVIDRAAAAREIARVLKPGGRFVASVWGSADVTDIVNFQQIAGSFAPPPPVEGVGPGALADPGELVRQLRAAGLDARVETDVTEFEFPDFASAWRALCTVTTANLDPSLQDEAKAAAIDAMWGPPESPRVFRNTTHFILADRAK